MKIAVLGNQARAVSNFWTVLLRRLVAAGHEPLCLVPEPSPDDDPAWEEALRGLGARLVHYPFDRKGLNPLRDLRTLAALRAVLARERPDRLFASTIKPVIYGSLAASLAASPPREHRTLMVTGLGYMFEADNPAKRLLLQAARLLYRLAFTGAGRVFFQNGDDLALFRRLGIIPRGLEAGLSRGTGVDTRRFAQMPPPDGPPVFLFVGRLLEAKGLREYMEAARLTRSRRPEAIFRVLGPAERGPGSVPLEEVLAAAGRGDIDYLGESRDVRPHLAAATAVVLPSWREGTPCSLLEAMSTGRPVVAADAPGSREAVRHGENGLLVPLKAPEALARAMQSLIEKPDEARRMGQAGRALAEREFDAEVVAASLMRAMRIPEV